MSMRLLTPFLPAACPGLKSAWGNGRAKNGSWLKIASPATQVGRASSPSRLPSQQFADLFSPPSQGAAMATGRPVTNNGSGFLPGRAPEAAPYRHMPLSQAPSRGWPGGIFFFCSGPGPSHFLAPPV